MTTWADIPVEQRYELLEHYSGAPSLQRIIPYAEKFGMNPQTLQRRLQELTQATQFQRDVLENGIQIPTIHRPVWKPMVIEADDLMLISDSEIPDQDDAMMEAFLLMAIKHGIRKAAFIGDATNNGAFSKWTKIVLGEDLSYPEELGLFGKILKVYMQWFEEFYVIPGNHDERSASATNGQVHLGTFLQMLGYEGRIHYTPLRQAYVRTSKGIVSLYHQKNSSEDGLTVARRMYDQEPGIDGQKPYMLFTTHSHHAAYGKSKDALCDCFALGCTRDPKKTLYIHQQPTTSAQWSQSFGMIKRGYGSQFERRSTDWEEALGGYYGKSLIRKMS